MSAVKVLYVSRWEEGNVETEALLNLETGEVYDIESSDEGAEYEYHIEDVIQIAVNGEVVTFNINEDTEFSYAIDEADLKKVREEALFEVLTMFGDEANNVDTVDEAPAYYSTRSGAVSSVKDFMAEVQKAVDDGDMDEAYDIDEFRIRDISSDVTSEVEIPIKKLKIS